MANASQATTEDYVGELIKLSNTKCLHEDRYWRILLHYKATLTGTKSLIDDPRFFLSPDGKTNPGSELKETIKSFFREPSEGEHPRCRFIARYSWLKETLNIDESLVPEVDCKDYREAVSKIKPSSSALIFPTALMGRPASMFGHTFIRLDSDYESRLLSYAVNYSAYTGEAGGFLYVLKGLFGSYKGYFSILPYYEKVKEYNDLEQRDIWEYNLNLSKEELQRMLMHIWELRDIYSLYYFFDENCSYNILFLLEAGRPSITLTDNALWVIPNDTVRAVMDSGMVESVNYRPSKATTINHISSLISPENQSLALKIINGHEKPENLSGNISQEEKIRVLDLSAEMLEYKYLKKELPKEEYLKRFLSVLNVRSQLPAEGSYKIPPPDRPDKGHGSARLSIGAGLKNNRFFQEISFRPAYHDLLDPDKGYMEGSQIVFADIRARYYDKTDEFRLHSFDFVDIVSISPQNKLFKPFSWKIKTGIAQRPHRDGKDHMLYYLNGGSGMAFKPRSTEAGLYYALLTADGNIGRKLNDKYSIGIGVSTGILKRINDFWKVNVSLSATYYGFGDKHKTLSGTVAQNFRVNAKDSISVVLSRVKTYGMYSSEARISWNLYF